MANGKIVVTEVLCLTSIMSISTAKSAGAFPSIRPGTISTVGSDIKTTMHKQAEWNEKLTAAR
jgi:hypothetical protein